MLQNKDVIYPELSYKINGILFGVRKRLGQYKNEQQYCDAIEEDLKKEGLNYEREKVLPESFEGEKAGRSKIDFLVEDKIILEIKAKPFVTNEDYYQTRRYLDCLGKKLGLLVNMRKYSTNPKRVLNSNVSVD